MCKIPRIKNSSRKCSEEAIVQTKSKKDLGIVFIKLKTEVVTRRGDEKEHTQGRQAKSQRNQSPWMNTKASCRNNCENFVVRSSWTGLIISYLPKYYLWFSMEQQEKIYF